MMWVPYRVEASIRVTSRYLHAGTVQFAVMVEMTQILLLANTHTRVVTVPVLWWSCAIKQHRRVRSSRPGPLTRHEHTTYASQPCLGCCLMSAMTHVCTLRAKLLVSLPMLQMVAISACKPSWSTRCGQQANSLGCLLHLAVWTRCLIVWSRRWGRANDYTRDVDQAITSTAVILGRATG